MGNERFPSSLAPQTLLEKVSYPLRVLDENDFPRQTQRRRLSPAEDSSVTLCVFTFELVIDRSLCCDSIPTLLQ